jgi:hypothetical protein
VNNFDELKQGGTTAITPVVVGAHAWFLLQNTKQAGASRN